MQERLQPEEQSLLAQEVRVRTTTELLLSLLRVRLEEVVQHTCSRAQKARRLRGQRDTQDSNAIAEDTVIMRI